LQASVVQWSFREYCGAELICGRWRCLSAESLPVRCSAHCCNRDGRGPIRSDPAGTAVPETVAHNALHASASRRSLMRRCQWVNEGELAPLGEGKRWANPKTSSPRPVPRTERQSLPDILDTMQAHKWQLHKAIVEISRGRSDEQKRRRAPDNTSSANQPAKMVMM
jgi:hypothetical protein